MLTAVWDPRETLSAGILATGYGYTDGALTSITPTSASAGGLTPLTLGYDASGRVTSVARAGAGTSSIDYDVPLSGTDLPTMTAAATAVWDQVVAPTTAVEVFPPGASTSDPRQGTITYMDTTGRTLNTAAYGAGGWNITATAYTAAGQVDWTLTAGNQTRALASTPLPGDPQGLPADDPITRARLLRTEYIYQDEVTTGGDPALLVDSFAPMADLALADGSIVTGRPHLRFAYGAGPVSVTDADGAPRTGPWRLATEVVRSASVPDSTGSATWADGTPYTDRDSITTTNAYGNVDGFADAGWLFATPTTVTVADVTPGHDLGTKTVLDSRGRVIETRQPMADPGDPGTTVTVYYTGDASAPGTVCDNKPEWAGLVCQVGPASQPVTGPTLPTTITTYNRDLQTTSEVETSGSTVRATTLAYDSGGRITTRSIAVTGAPAGDVAVPNTTNTYWSETGLLKSVTSGGATATTSYDTLGRVTTQTDGAGNTATITYDPATGRVTSTNDGKATTNYAYDGTDSTGKTEYRGFVTSMVVGGLVGASEPFRAAYDEDGRLVSETSPNGMVATTTRDPAGRATELTYTTGAGSLVAGFSRVWTADARVAEETGLGRHSGYDYDAAGRLTRARQTVLGLCTVREYEHDDNSNRTALHAWNGSSSSCPSVESAADESLNRAYDEADRAVLVGANSAYTYDALGRTRTLPGEDAPSGVDAVLTYHSNDLVSTVSAGDTTRTYGLDALGRISSWSDTVGGEAGPTHVNHYAGTSDSPAWIDEGDGTWSRTVTSISGTLAMIVSGDASGPTSAVGQIVDPHGDVVATVDNVVGASTVSSTAVYEEFGAQVEMGSQPARYGWLGGHQRPTEAPADLTLMGARVYNPATGRFLQVDPVRGGNSGPYLYPTDPITGYDLDGRKGQRIFEAAGCLMIGLFWCNEAISVSKAVRKFAERYKKRNKREAARHFIWNLVLMGTIGFSRTVVFTTSHEVGDWFQSSRGDQKESTRDLRNNSYARSWKFRWRASLYSRWVWGGLNGAISRANRVFLNEWRTNRRSFTCIHPDHGRLKKCKQP